MDLNSNKYLEGGASNGFCIKNPFLDTYSDPLCKLNLKETSEFVNSFPLANNGTESRGFLAISAQSGVFKRNLEAPPTPGRPIFSFSNGNFSRKSFPSKWDDAEKWLVSGHDSPAHNQGLLLKTIEPSRILSRQCSGYKPQLIGGGELFTEKSRVIVEKVSTFESDHNSSSRAYNRVSADLLLKDKFPNPKSVFSEPMQEGFLFQNGVEKSINESTIQTVNEVIKHRDIGTEMTPLGSSKTSRCPTPFMSTSPARHNTPTSRSGPLGLDTSSTIDLTVTQLQECLNLESSQFDLVGSNWSSREEEEDDVSKSLRHFEMNSECRKSVAELKGFKWEEEEKNKRCLRYQREEAKIQAWVNLQSAKAEAESRKLEVKIQKLRLNLEEKLMKKMADVHRKAEEWRATIQFQHSEQIRKVNQQARKGKKNINKSCSCFPCNKHHI